MKNITRPLALFAFLFFAFLAVNIPYGYSSDSDSEDESHEWAAQKLLGKRFVGKVNKQLLTGKRFEKYQKKNRELKSEKEVAPFGETAGFVEKKSISEALAEAGDVDQNEEQAKN